MDVILKSRAFWTAVIGVISAVVAHYANIPGDVWQPILALLGVIVTLFTVDDLGEKLGRTIGRTLYELREKNK